MKWTLLVVCLLALASPGFSAKILGVFPFFGRSHFAMTSSVIKALAQQGHEVRELSQSAASIENYNGFGPLDYRNLVTSDAHIEHNQHS